MLTWVRVDLFSYLFGDVLAVGSGDILLIWGGGAGVLAILAAIRRPLLAATVNEDIARAEGMAVDRAEIVFTLLLAVVIALRRPLSTSTAWISVRGVMIAATSTSWSSMTFSMISRSRS